MEPANETSTVAAAAAGTASGVDVGTPSSLMEADDFHLRAVESDESL